MRWWFSYWHENLRRSLGLWEEEKATTAFIAALVFGLLGAAIGYGTYALAAGSVGVSVLVGLVSWFGLLVLIVTPMRMWRERVAHLASLTTPRLVVSLEPSMQHIGSGVFSQWVNVVNPTGQTIHRCYGKIRSFERIYPSHSSARLPREGHELPWAHQSGGGRFATDISGFDGIAHLDIAMVKGGADEFLRIPAKSVADRDTTDYDAYVCLPGAYDLVIEVGSTVESFKSSAIRLRITFGGGTDVNVTELSGQ